MRVCVCVCVLNVHVLSCAWSLSVYDGVDHFGHHLHLLFLFLFVLDVAWASLGIDAFVVIRFAKGRSRRRSFVIVDDRNPR